MERGWRRAANPSPSESLKPSLRVVGGGVRRRTGVGKSRTTTLGRPAKGRARDSTAITLWTNVQRGTEGYSKAPRTWQFAPLEELSELKMHTVEAPVLGVGSPSAPLKAEVQLKLRARNACVNGLAIVQLKLRWP